MTIGEAAQVLGAQYVGAALLRGQGVGDPRAPRRQAHVQPGASAPRAGIHPADAAPRHPSGRGVGLVLDEPSDQWRDVVREQIAAIEELIARANGAHDFLEHALACPADHPVDQCPHMIEVLDKRLDGLTIEGARRRTGPAGT